MVHQQKHGTLHVAQEVPQTGWYRVLGSARGTHVEAHVVFSDTFVIHMEGHTSDLLERLSWSHAMLVSPAPLPCQTCIPVRVLPSLRES